MHVQGDSQYLPPWLYGFLPRLHEGCIFLWSPSREKTRGEIGEEEEENIAKQSDHVLKPWFKRIKSTISSATYVNTRADIRGHAVPHILSNV